MLIEITREKGNRMLFNILQMGMGSLDEYKEIIISLVSIVAAILILKLGLILTKAQYRRKIKWN